VREPRDGGHGASLAGGPIHDRCVQLDLAEEVRQASDANVMVGLVRLGGANRDLDGVHRART
jgi:hypothetical protein